MRESETSATGETLGPKLTMKELATSGILQEANRQFFHPLGLALGITWGEDWSGELFIFDSRDDPEGNIFLDLSSDEDSEKADNVSMMKKEKASNRLAMFGWIIQPIGHKLED